MRHQGKRSSYKRRFCVICCGPYLSSRRDALFDSPRCRQIASRWTRKYSAGRKFLRHVAAALDKNELHTCGCQFCMLVLHLERKPIWLRRLIDRAQQWPIISKRIEKKAKKRKR